ncbi:AfaD family invasin [Hafnia paralvei]|uniref:AfaD family invasin n=1 Tax=Hafnia paralvei TaxID=546367 RepID=UPI001034D0CA|nr:AfaD family invasin [Hafnia paralvei]TBL64164.1 invasin [Hafnia paralvei]
MIKLRGLITALLVTISAFQAQADENRPDLTVSMRPHLSSTVHGGERIGSGQITYRGEHVGFQVWLDGMTSGGAPERYVMKGRNNPGHELRVLIGQDGWIPDSKDGRGIIKQTGEPQASFDIIVDGEQVIEADEYSMTVYGVYFTL